MGSHYDLHDQHGDIRVHAGGPSAHEHLPPLPSFGAIATAKNEETKKPGRPMTALALQEGRLARPSRSIVDWKSYAGCYDLLCSLNPAYLELLNEFSSFVRNANLPTGSRILDLGGGTGNFFCHALPREISRTSELIHLDFDSEMLGIAKEKYSQHGLNVKTIHRDASRSIFPVASLDCIVSVNALYAMPQPVTILERAFHWLRPGGHLFLINLGRIQDTTEWTAFLVKSNAPKIGFLKTLRILLNEGMVISKANRKIAEAQRSGVYWQHETEDLGKTLRAIGFELDELRPVYRGYSDLACARKPTKDAASTTDVEREPFDSPLRMGPRRASPHSS
jgi:ubiquinone/menaquinone biosynthesis C-methylase UbiE